VSAHILSAVADEPPPFPFSRETDIRIDVDGRFWHEGTPVTHERLARALASWIDVEPESGRYILKNELQWCYIRVDDAPLVVRSAAPAGDSLELSLSDGTRERLDPGSLRLRGDVPYCRVRGGRLPARFSPQAAFVLLEQVVVEGGRLVLRLGGRDHLLVRE
jgi:hypothetical protein